MLLARNFLTIPVNTAKAIQDEDAEFVFKIPKIISCLLKQITHHAGKIIAAGILAGFSELQPGDDVTGEIKNIRILENKVVVN